MCQGAWSSYRVCDKMGFEATAAVWMMWQDCDVWIHCDGFMSEYTVMSGYTVTSRCLDKL